MDLKEIVKNAIKTALREGYDQFVCKDADNDYVFERAYSTNSLWNIQDLIGEVKISYKNGIPTAAFHEYTEVEKTDKLRELKINRIAAFGKEIKFEDAEISKEDNFYYLKLDDPDSEEIVMRSNELQPIDEEDPDIQTALSLDFKIYVAEFDSAYYDKLELRLSVPSKGYDEMIPMKGPEVQDLRYKIADFLEKERKLAVIEK